MRGQEELQERLVGEPEGAVPFVNKERPAKRLQYAGIRRDFTRQFGEQLLPYQTT